MTEDYRRLLVVDDDPNHAELIKGLIKQAGLPFDVDAVHTFADGLVHLAEQDYAICILDYRLDEVDGVELMRRVRMEGVQTPVILLTAQGNEDVAVSALKSGATDYLRKGNLSAEKLETAIRYTLGLHQQEQLRREAEEALRTANELLEARVEERTAELKEANARLQAEINERRHIEAELREANLSLTEADRLKDEMIQNISHEFRTPLSYVIGYADLILEEPGDLSEAQLNYAEIVSSQAQRLAWFVQNFVSFQHIQDMASERKPVDLQGLLSSAVGNAGLMASQSEIGLDFEADTLPLVVAEKVSIEQVINNLLANAFKFTPEGGSVMVRATLDESGDKAVVSVADTGIGIPTDQHEHIFERFYQVDGTPTRRFGGVGLGLALCKEIIEAHGESLWVESEEGQGATFFFTLPVATEQTTA